MKIGGEKEILELCEAAGFCDVMYNRTIDLRRTWMNNTELNAYRCGKKRAHDSLHNHKGKL